MSRGVRGRFMPRLQRMREAHACMHARMQFASRKQRRYCTLPSPSPPPPHFIPPFAWRGELAGLLGEESRHAHSCPGSSSAFLLLGVCSVWCTGERGALSLGSHSAPIASPPPLTSTFHANIHTHSHNHTWGDIETKRLHTVACRDDSRGFVCPITRPSASRS